MLPSEGPNDYSKECTRLTEEKQVHNDTIHTHSHGKCQEEDKEIKGEENDDSLNLELILPCESKPAEITYAGKSYQIASDNDDQKAAKEADGAEHSPSNIRRSKIESKRAQFLISSEVDEMLTDPPPRFKNDITNGANRKSIECSNGNDGVVKKHFFQTEMNVDQIISEKEFGSCGSTNQAETNVGTVALIKVPYPRTGNDASDETFHQKLCALQEFIEKKDQVPPSKRVYDFCYDIEKARVKVTKERTEALMAIGYNFQRPRGYCGNDASDERFHQNLCALQEFIEKKDQLPSKRVYDFCYRIENARVKVAKERAEALMAIGYNFQRPRTCDWKRSIEKKPNTEKCRKIPHPKTAKEACSDETFHQKLCALQEFIEKKDQVPPSKRVYDFCYDIEKARVKVTKERFEALIAIGYNFQRPGYNFQRPRRGRKRKWSIKKKKPNIEKYRNLRCLDYSYCGKRMDADAPNNAIVTKNIHKKKDKKHKKKQKLQREMNMDQIISDKEFGSCGSNNNVETNVGTAAHPDSSCTTGNDDVDSARLVDSTNNDKSATSLGKRSRQEKQDTATSADIPSSVTTERTIPDEQELDIKREPLDPSSTRHTTTDGAFDQQDYNMLRTHYFEPKVRKNEEIPNGMQLRKRHAPAAIDGKTRGYKELKQQIQKLEINNDDKGIYRLLKELRRFEVSRTPISSFVRGDDDEDDEVTEIIDLTGILDDDDDGVIDVDTFIIDFLLVEVIKPDPDAVPSSSTYELTQQQLKEVKADPDAEA